MKEQQTASPERQLVKKLAAAMKAVKNIQKRGHNKHFDYDFATEADVVAALREELADRNVMLLPSIIADERVEVGRTSGGATKWLTNLRMVFSFIDGDTGEQIDREWRGAGVDTEDKGLYKAMTGGGKYFLLKSFLIPTGDDPEATSETEKGQASPQQASPASQRQATASRASTSRAGAQRRQTSSQAAPKEGATQAASAASPTKTPTQAPPGALVLADVKEHQNADKVWHEAIFTNGERALIVDPKVAASACVYKVEKCAVACVFSVNAKVNKPQIDKIDRAKAAA